MKKMFLPVTDFLDNKMVSFASSQFERIFRWARLNVPCLYGANRELSSTLSHDREIFFYDRGPPARENVVISRDGM